MTNDMTVVVNGVEVRLADVTPIKDSEMTKLRLKRICPGSYVTTDGQYEIHGFQRPEKNGYGSAGEWTWYWRPVNDAAHDRFYTKREAVESLTSWINEHK
jgi:hypothetical protein